MLPATLGGKARAGAGASTPFEVDLRSGDIFDSLLLRGLDGFPGVPGAPAGPAVSAPDAEGGLPISMMGSDGLLPDDAFPLVTLDSKPLAALVKPVMCRART